MNCFKKCGAAIFTGIYSASMAHAIFRSGFFGTKRIEMSETETYLVSKDKYFFDVLCYWKKKNEKILGPYFRFSVKPMDVCGGEKVIEHNSISQ